MKRNVTGCSIETAIHVIGGRWRAILLYQLLQRGTMRFSDLRRAVPAITQRMLTQDLRTLERAGVVRRTVYPEVPPRVEYALTPRGESLRPVIDALTEWGRLQEADHPASLAD
jgi:DNA-binding HxlR family transcriptional regulator